MTWDDDKFIAFDTETTGTLREYALQPWRVAQGKSWLTSLATTHKAGNQLIVGGGIKPDKEMLRDFLVTSVTEGRTIVGWNTVFDIAWLLAYDLEELVFKAKWLDGMLLWKHYFVEPEYDLSRANKKSYGLKTCVEEVLPQFAGYQDDVTFDPQTPAEWKQLHDYNIRDTAFTLRLARHWYSRLTPRQLRAALLEAECLPLVARANLDGMIVDQLTAAELGASLADTAAQKRELLAQHIVGTQAAYEVESAHSRTAKGRALPLTELEIADKIIRSPIKLATLIFDDWKLPTLKENIGKKTGTVSRSTDQETLHELAFRDPRAQELRDYREALGNRTKFADAPLNSVAYNEDGRTHPAAIVFGTYSGRMTYSSSQGKNKDKRQTGFALHQEKREKYFREILIAPDGYTLVEFDASGQEFRWMAVASGDPTMLALCEPNEDAHSYMAARVAQVDYQQLCKDVKAGIKQAGDHRQVGKVANLSLQYRTSARKLCSTARVKHNIPMVLPQAQMIHKVYQETYRAVPVYWAQQIAQTKHQGYVETLAGRRVQVQGDWSGPLGWSMGSTAINYQIQGTGGDQKYLALAVIRACLATYGARFAWDLHDGVYFYVPDAQVERFVVSVQAKLNNLPYGRAWGFTPPIAMPWDAKVGKSWGGLKEWRDG